MSRIIKLIINSVLKSYNQEYIFVHNNLSKDIDIARQIDGIPVSFEKNNFDLNKIIKIISEQDMALDLTFLPKFVVCTSLIRYQQAMHLSSLLRVPLINIIYDINNVKKEGIFSLAHHLDNNINILFDEHTAMKLYLTNFNIIPDIKLISGFIEEGYKNWKPE